MNKELIKKLVAALLVFNIVLPLVASAAVPVFETNPSLLGDNKITAAKTTGTLVEAIITAIQEVGNLAFDNWLQAFETWWHFIFLVLMELFKLRVLDTMTGQIVAWITGGNGGLPQFVTNWQNFLGDQGQLAADIVLSQIDQAAGGLLCTPFAAQLQLALRPPSLPRFGLNLDLPRLGSFPYNISCSLDQIVGNVQNFYNDFNQGGWLGFETLLEPNNNYYGTLAETLDFQDQLTAAKVEAARNEGLAGQGYLGTRLPFDLSGLGLQEFNITTPGFSIGETVNRAVGNRFDYIVNAQQMASLVAVIVDGFLNKLIGSGDEGLLGYGNTANPGPGFISSAPDNCAGLTGPALQACLIAKTATSTNIAHLECVSNACSPVAGPGTDTCSPQGSFCDVHLGCLDQACVMLSGASPDECAIQGEFCSSTLPVVGLVANPTSITVGGSSVLTWSAVNATQCTAAGGWSGTKNFTGGTQTVTPALTSTYSLSCTSVTGAATASVTVTVNPLPGGGGGGGGAGPTHLECNGFTCIRIGGVGQDSCQVEGVSCGTPL
jgi:hypothetical protein